jgi:hypothetical protein
LRKHYITLKKKRDETKFEKKESRQNMTHKNYKPTPVKTAQSRLTSGNLGGGG